MEDDDLAENYNFAAGRDLQSDDSVVAVMGNRIGVAEMCIGIALPRLRLLVVELRLVSSKINWLGAILRQWVDGMNLLMITADMMLVVILWVH